MSEPKRPVPGEYWGCWNRPAVRIIGFDGLECVVRHKDGRLTTLATGNWQKTDGGWKHLPWCKSFDDVEPVAEVWPKYVFGDLWQTSVVAYLRRDSEIATTYVRIDGTEEPYEYQDYLVQKLKSGEWRYIPESKALARRTPKCPDCGELAGDGHADVCPMAWVVQDRVPARPGVDERVYEYSDSGMSNNWEDCSCINWHYSPRHGAKSGIATLHLRCRRKDLPPNPEDPPVTRETVHQWIVEWMVGKQFTLTSSS